MRFLLIAALLALAGCYGVELRTGIGHMWNDSSARGGVHRSNDWEVFEHSFDVEEDDSLSAWVELGFQLTPTAVEFYNPPTRATVVQVDPAHESIPPLSIKREEPQPEPPIPLRESDDGMAEVLAAIEALTEKLDALEARQAEHEQRVEGFLGWSDLLVGGGATGGGGAVLFWLYVFMQRRKQQAAAAGKAEE